MDEKKAQAYRIGMAVILLLAVLTVGEYLLGSIAFTWWQPLMVIGLIKAYFVVRDYMHIGRVFNPEQEQPL